MRKILLLVASIVLAPALAWADGYTVPNYSPRDLSMVGSTVAAQEGAGGTYYNPSSLARTEGLNLTLAASLIDIRSTWHDPAGVQQPVEMIAKAVFPPALFASFGMKLDNPFTGKKDMGVAAGVGFNVPYGGNVFWPDTWPGRFDILTVERRIYATYFSVAVQPLPFLRLGSGFIWYRGTEKLSQAATAGALPQYETTAELATAGNAYSFDLSAEVDPLPGLRFGIDYKHQAPMTLTGNAHFVNPAPQLAGQGLVDQAVTHQLTMPNLLMIGAAYQVLPVLLLTAQFSWERYIVYDKDAFIGPLFGIVVPRNYHNSQTYKLGAEYSGVENLRLRAGVAYNVCPTPPEWMSPTIPDGNVWGVGVGASYNISKWVSGMELYAAYYHDFFNDVSTVHNPQNVLAGNYSTFANIASIGLTWNWDPFKAEAPASAPSAKPTSSSAPPPAAAPASAAAAPAAAQPAAAQPAPVSPFPLPPAGEGGTRMPPSVANPEKAPASTK
jgi:long-chain fatty acid transport protein